MNLRFHSTGFLLLSIFLSFFLSACAGIPLRHDPQQVLNQAEAFIRTGDYLHDADRNTREVIDEAERDHNERLLANAYKIYGDLLSSKTIEHKGWPFDFKLFGFSDRSVTYATRKEKSLEYYRKAHDLYVNLKAFDALARVDWYKAYVYSEMNRKQEACATYDEALRDYEIGKKGDSKFQIVIPPQYANFEEFITAQKKGAACLER